MRERDIPQMQQWLRSCLTRHPSKVPGKDGAERIALWLLEKGYEIGLKDEWPVMYSGTSESAGSRPNWVEGWDLIYSKGRGLPDGARVPIVPDRGISGGVKALIVYPKSVVEATLMSPFSENSWSVEKEFPYDSLEHLEIILEELSGSAKCAWDVSRTKILIVRDSAQILCFSEFPTEVTVVDVSGDENKGDISYLMLPVDLVADVGKYAENFEIYQVLCKACKK